MFGVVTVKVKLKSLICLWRRRPSRGWGEGDLEDPGDLGDAGRPSDNRLSLMEVVGVELPESKASVDPDPHVLPTVRLIQVPPTRRTITTSGSKTAPAPMVSVNEGEMSI